MPLLLDTPGPDGNNAVEIESFTTYGINSTIRVSIVYGAGAWSGSAYVEDSSRRRVDFVGGSIVAKMQAALAAGDTIYGAIKVALYELLQEQGYVGPGTVV